MLTNSWRERAGSAKEKKSIPSRRLHLTRDKRITPPEELVRDIGRTTRQDQLLGKDRHRAHVASNVIFLTNATIICKSFFNANEVFYHAHLRPKGLFFDVNRLSTFELWIIT
jgi:hypothetical protein